MESITPIYPGDGNLCKRLGCLGCGYFLATMKPAKNQVILSNGVVVMTGNSRVIEANEEHPRV